MPVGAERRLRLLRDPDGPAAWNMAVDDALLELARVPTLRLYGWQPHAVSLGWFQPWADFATLPPDTPVVRRATGGGAIHHGDEMTFSLALDAERLPGDVAAGYGLLHDAVQRALADCGVASERLATGHAQRARPGSPWCFADPGRDDLVTERGKLLGSAQRRVRTDRPRVLHHGSLVLHAPPLTPFVAAVADVRPVDEALRQQLAERLTSRFAEVLDLEPFPGALTAGERALATRLQHERHEDPARLRRR